MRRALAGAVATTLVSVTIAILPATSAPATAIAAEAATATDSGTFNALSYNIAGLPEFLSSAPTPRVSATRAIGERLGPYDIVHVQEDFNYHAHLYATDTHPYRTATSGGVPFGSGLNTLSGFAYDEADFERVKWNACDSNSGDCLTPKGFTFMRTRLAEGVYVDFYNLHADAGSDSGDLSARASNFAQLSSFIQSHSAGNAVVVMGDTNTRYTRTVDGTTIRNFASANGLTDPWVQLVRGGNAPAEGSDALVCDSANPTTSCEIVDKFWYRGSRLVTLNATSYNNKHADFLEDGTGRMLSDHHPISVGFNWTKNPAYQLSEQHGGPHGDYFNDIDRVAWGAQASTISLRAGERVDQVGVTLADGTTLTHGGTGGTYSSLTLGSTEYVTSAYLCQAERGGHTRIFYAKFTTNQGRTLAGGSTTSDCVTRTAPDGWQIAGFTGRSGDEVDKIGFIYTPNDVMLVSRATGKCLEVNGWSTADAANVQLWSCHGGVNQRWRIEPLADGTVRIVNQGSNKPLDVANCGTADGTDIQQYSWWDNPCQRWSVLPTDGGWVRLRNPNSDKVADVANCGTADGTDVRLWSWQNNNCQQWQVRL